MSKVFVYGSLKKGYHNHRLLSESEFLGEARTKPVFTMVSLGAFPGVVNEGHTSIFGEVYEVNAHVLNALDALEGHPHFYERVRVVLDAHEQEAVWMYILNPEYNKRVGTQQYPVVNNGKW